MDMDMSLYSLPEDRLKVVVVGAAAVGKTTIINHWAGLPVPDHYQPTQGVRECEVRKDFMKELNACLVFHDVGSDVAQDRDRAARVLTDADAVVLVYSCYQLQETMGVLRETWMPLVKSVTPHVYKVFLSAGNYEAIKNQDNVLVAPEEEKFYDEFECYLKDFFYCSLVHYGTNEEEVLQKLFRHAHDGLHSRTVFNEPASSLFRARSTRISQPLGGRLRRHCALL